MVTKSIQSFKKGQLKTVGGVDYTNSFPLSVTNGQNDGQTHRRADGRGIKSNLCPFLSGKHRRVSFFKIEQPSTQFCSLCDIDIPAYLTFNDYIQATGSSGITYNGPNICWDSLCIH